MGDVSVHAEALKRNLRRIRVGNIGRSNLSGGWVLLEPFTFREGLIRAVMNLDRTSPSEREVLHNQSPSTFVLDHLEPDQIAWVLEPVNPNAMEVLCRIAPKQTIRCRERRGAVLNVVRCDLLVHLRVRADLNERARAANTLSSDPGDGG